MKKALLLFFAVSFLSCGMKPIHVDPEPVSEVVPLEGSQEDLYVKANNWMVQNFVDAKSVIQFSDKEAGVVTGKYLMGNVYPDAVGSPMEDVFAIIKIQVKDDAGKITILPESYSYITSMGTTEDQRLSQEKLNSQIDVLINSFEDYMQNANDTF